VGAGSARHRSPCGTAHLSEPPHAASTPTRRPADIRPRTQKLGSPSGGTSVRV
jgi:hypothetical protein